MALDITTLASTDKLSDSRGDINTNFTNIKTDCALIDQSMYIGTTAVAINRASATLNLAGIGTLACGAITSTGQITAINQSGARAYRNTSNQTIGTGSWTKVELNAESWDTQGEFDSTTNYRFTATYAGYYQVNASLYWVTLTDQSWYAIKIRKDGASDWGKGFYRASGTGDMSTHTSDIIYLAAGSYIELYCYQNTGGDDAINNGESQSYMSVHKLS